VCKIEKIGNAKFFASTDAIALRIKFESQTQRMNRVGPKRPKTINL